MPPPTPAPVEYISRASVIMSNEKKIESIPDIVKNLPSTPVKSVTVIDLTEDSDDEVNLNDSFSAKNETAENALTAVLKLYERNAKNLGSPSNSPKKTKNLQGSVDIEKLDSASGFKDEPYYNQNSVFNCVFIKEAEKVGMAPIVLVTNRSNDKENSSFEHSRSAAAENQAKSPAKVRRVSIEVESAPEVRKTPERPKVARKTVKHAPTVQATDVTGAEKTSEENLRGENSIENLSNSDEISSVVANSVEDPTESTSQSKTVEKVQNLEKPKSSDATKPFTPYRIFPKASTNPVSKENDDQVKEKPKRGKRGRPPKNAEKQQKKRDLEDEAPGDLKKRRQSKKNCENNSDEDCQNSNFGDENVGNVANIEDGDDEDLLVEIADPKTPSGRKSRKQTRTPYKKSSDKRHKTPNRRNTRSSHLSRSRSGSRHSRSTSRSRRSNSRKSLKTPGRRKSFFENLVTEISISGQKKKNEETEKGGKIVKNRKTSKSRKPESTQSPSGNEENENEDQLQDDSTEENHPEDQLTENDHEGQPDKNETPPDPIENHDDSIDEEIQSFNVSQLENVSKQLLVRLVRTPLPHESEVYMDSDEDIDDNPPLPLDEVCNSSGNVSDSSTVNINSVTTTPEEKIIEDIWLVNVQMESNEPVLKFFVKWDQCPIEANTYEPYEKVEKSEVLRDYIAKKFQKHQDRVDKAIEGILMENRVLYKHFREKPKIQILEQLEEFDLLHFKCNILAFIYTFIEIPATSAFMENLRNGSILYKLHSTIEREKIANEKFLSKLMKKEKGHVKFTAENLVDYELVPNFEYIKHMTYPQINKEGCKCIKDCHTSKKCCPSSFDRECVYNSEGRIATEKYQLIIECGDACECPKDCPNRPKSLNYDMCIFKTHNRGWGLRASEDIPTGAFIIENTGEIIGKDEAQRRSKLYDQVGVTYLFALDSWDETNDVSSIDSIYKGNLARFINHSCKPNLEIWKATSCNEDPKTHRIYYFSVRNIKAGEELTIDYTGGNVDSGLTMNPPEDAFPCKCGAENCREYIF